MVGTDYDNGHESQSFHDVVLVVGMIEAKVSVIE